MIERTVLTMSAEQKAVQDSIARAQEQERQAAINALRMKEEQEAQQRRLEEERVRQQEEQARLQKEEQEAQQRRMEEERARQKEELRQQKEAEQKARQQEQEIIAQNADPYYIAWLMKTQCFNPIYRKEVQEQFDVPTIMRLINEYTAQELFKKAQGHHSSLHKYVKIK